MRRFEHYVCVLAIKTYRVALHFDAMTTLYERAVELGMIKHPTVSVEITVRGCNEINGCRNEP